MPNDAILPGFPVYTGLTVSQIANLSNTLTANAEEFANNLTTQAAALIAPTINPNFPTVANAPTPAVVAAPSLQMVTWNVPAEPAPFAGTVGSLTGLLPGTFTGQAPALSFPAAPGALGVAAPTAPPVDLNFTYPTVAVTLPTPPNLLSLDTIPFNPVTIPTFDVTVPALTISPPGVVPYVEGSLYTSALLTAAKANLQQAITDGTWTGLPAPVQQAMEDAAAEREYVKQALTLAQIDRDHETLGYAYPPGAFLDARNRALTETNYVITGLSRDIFVQVSKLALDNIVKAREDAVELEGKLIDYTNNVAQRAFETAKYLTQAAIEIYNAQVQTYVASLEGYKTEALVYDTQVKGILAQIEVLKAEIQFEQVKAEINTALVQQYKTEVEAAEAILEVYKTQIEIIQTQASVEKIKVDVFGAQIQAFVGQVQAYTAQVEAYKAQAETQGIIESAYKTGVDAYAAEVQAGVAQVTAQVEVFKAEISAYEADLAGYDSAIKGMIGQAQAASEFNQSSAAVYRAAVEAITSYNGTLTGQWEAVMREQTQIAQIGVAAAKENGDLYLTTRQLSIDAAKVGAQVNAQLGAAALGAVHWSQSISAAVSASNSDVTEEIQSESA